MAGAFGNEKLVLGVWERERKLGQGQFGCVTLWRNITTKEYVVIKQCIVELSPKNKRRWRDEIACLNSLKHDNLVSTRETPEEVARFFAGTEPCLGLEYCEGGDLRKVLNFEDNCVGLREKTVLAILKDVSNGIAFLHEHKIIHRDIKPENILICYIGNKVIYKITDLGYAKQLDQTSLCTSFVGTLNYIAPELYNSDAYFSEVDFWSFGTMIFECITGRRPFEIHGQLVQWYQLIASKGNDDIWGEVSESGQNVVFHKTLAEPNRLSRPIADMFVKLLRLMLRWQPAERGGFLDAHGKRECHYIIQDILATKVVHVFSISNGRTSSYRVNEIDRVDRLHALIDKDYDVSAQDQELLLPTGTPVNSTDLLQSHEVEMETTERLIFMINRHSVSSLLSPLPPDSVQVMVGSPETPLNFETCKRIWGHSLHFCLTAAQRYKRLLQGLRAVLIKLNRANAILAKRKEEIVTEDQKFESFKTMLSRSIEFDLEQYYRYEFHEREGSLWVKQELEGLLTQVRQFKLVNTSDFKEKVRQEQTKFLNIRKHPLGSQSESELDRIATKVRAFNTDLRRSDAESKAKLRTSEDIAMQVMEVIETSDELDTRLSQHFRNTWSCLSGIESLTNLICTNIEDIREGQRQLQEWNEYKLSIPWRLATYSRTPTPSRVSIPSDYGSTASSIAHILDHSMPSITINPSALDEALDRQQEKLRQIIDRMKLETTSQDQPATRRKTMERSKASSLDNERQRQRTNHFYGVPPNDFMKSM